MSIEPYYDDGQITIYHGDCRDVLPSLAGAFDAVVTDPPYGLGAIMRGGEVHWPLWEGRSQDGLPWDGEAPDWLAGVVAQARYAIVWGGNYFPLPPARGWLVWDKIVREFSSGHCELAWTNLDQPVRAYNWSHGQLASEGKHHPTQKPVSLMRWCIGFLPADALTILDPFAGSLTTAVAAKQMGRRCIAIEREERYVIAGLERLRQGVLL